MSVGLKFSKPFRPRRAQSVPAYRFPVLTDALANIPAPVAIAPVADVPFTPKRVYFESSMSRIRPQDAGVLDEVARHMLRNADLEVVIRAHADSSGNVEYNRILAEDRAWQTTLHLLRAGVDYGRIRRESYGSDVPETDNLTPEGRAQNRRLELMVRRRADAEPMRMEAVDASIQALADEMRTRPDIRLQIESWHPVPGSAATQRFLATAQASRIQRLLVEQGVDPDRIEVMANAGGKRRSLLLRVTETW
jgi:outer membrane protein OmpA-like peptidoglycan-associated protein